MRENKLTARKKIISYLIMALLVVSIFAFSASFSLIVVSAQDVKYCCERTDYGAWCQEAPEDECDSGYRMTPTSCESTSYCRQGCCYDSNEGICMENTPQKVCQDSGGTWSEGKECDIPQCQLGCCVLGTQAAFVTLTRCKKLSSLYGLLTDFRKNVGTELECISLTALRDEGACIYEVDYIKTCQFTTRQGCDSLQVAGEEGAVTSSTEFFKDYLCSAEELETNCGPTKDTTCVKGKDEVFFVDSCGNIANIYDASKVKDKSYWRKKISKAEACGAGSANINSKTCGNCNYFEGSICRNVKGNNICKDLNCKASEMSDKKPHKHGESWCSTDKYEDSVGSRYYRHLCMNGEEIIEPCADFRQEVCIQDSIETTKGPFSQAACRVNRWQECYSQTEKIDCENTDKRDCKWIAGEGSLKCVPLHSPGFKFWEEGESEGLCSQANAQCIVTFVKEGILGGSKDCESNCECLEDSWRDTQLAKCECIGDCGAKVNFVGEEGNKAGYKITTEKAKEEEEGGGGLFGVHMILSKLGINIKAVEEQENDKNS